MKLQKLCILAVSLSIAGCSDSPTPTSQVASQTTDTPEKIDLQLGSSPETDEGDAEEKREYQEGEDPVTDGGPEEDSGDSSGGFGRRGSDPTTFVERSDTDGDGKLSGDEIPFWMAGADANEDGGVTQEEFLAWREERGFGGGRGQRSRGTENGQGRAGGFDPTAIFERRDTNADGKLTDDEISERMRGNMQQFDGDSDGAITLEEFQNGMSRRFGRGGGSGGSGRFGGSRGNPREGRPDRPKRPELEE